MRLFFSFLAITVLSGCGQTARDYESKGDRSYSSGEYADAELNYLNALKKNSALGNVEYKLGLTLVKENKGAMALQTLKRAAVMQPKDIDVKVAFADVAFAIYFQSGRQSKELYGIVAGLGNEILALNPNSPDGFRLRGELSLADHKAADSAEFYRKANELRPMNGEIVLGYTQSLFQAGQTAQAEDVARAFLANTSGYAPLWDSLYNQYMASNRLADAEKTLYLWIEKNPGDSAAVLSLAGYYTRLHKPADAAAALQRMIDHPSGIPMAHMLAGDFYTSIGDWQSATTQYEAGARSDKQNSIAYRKKIATALLGQGKQQQALNALDSIIGQVPQDSEARLSRAHLWLDMGSQSNVTSALTDLQALLKENPQDPGLLYDAGRAYRVAGDITQAKTSFRKAAQLRDDFLPPRFELGQIALSQRNPADAIRYSDEILAAVPGNPAARLMRASGLMDAGRLVEAGSALRQLVQDYPQYREAAIQTGLLAIYEGKFAEAERVFAKLGDSENGDIRPNLGLATAYSSQKQYDRALQILTAEASRAPGSAPIEGALILTAMQARNYHLAIEASQRMIAADPASLPAYLNLAESLRLAGNTADSTAALERATHLNSKDPSALMAMATAFYRAGRLDDSKTCLRAVVKLQGDSSPALNDLAFLAVESGGDLNEAQQLAERSLQKDPQNINARDTLGWILLKENRAANALPILDGVVRQNPDNPTYRYHLGAALVRNGDKDRARTELQSALSKGAGPDDSKNIRELLSQLH